MTVVTIAVDVMGGDFGPHAVIPACKNFLQQYPNVKIITFGKEEIVRPLIADIPHAISSRIDLIHVDQAVTMDDTPLVALRNKPRSSMRMALECVRGGVAAACVSAGNTGALMALSVHIIGRLDGIDRPAICSQIPTSGNNTYLLDLGANVDCSADNLLQFARMATAYVSAVERKKNPSIALLNIGEEQTKGNAQVKAAAVLMLAAEDIRYVGFVEGGDIFSGRVDAIVCDGFVGNIALKTSEGVARFLFNSIKAAAKRTFLTKIIGGLAFLVFRNFYQRLDPRQLNGAVFLGLDGLVIKSHGNADSLAFMRALEKAYEAVQCNVLSSLQKKIGAVVTGSDC